MPIQRFASLLFVCACMLRPAPVEAAAPAVVAVSGRVHLQADARRASDGRGLADVAVSNGVDIVRTDAHGRYRIAAVPGKAVFVVKPAGYRFVAGSDGLPAFWRTLPADAGPAATADFVLLPGATGAPARDAKALDVLLFADSQVKSERDVDYYRRDIVEPIIGRHPAALGVTWAPGRR